MTALVLLASVLHGHALVRWLRIPWPLAARLGAALVVGPCVLTLVFFLALQAGLPHGAPLAFGVALLGAGAALLGPQTRGSSQPLRCWLGPALLAALVAALLLVRLLQTPTPEGDGLFHFALKARALHVLGSPWSFLSEPHLAVIHPDYPLHMPLIMDLGYLMGGEIRGWAALLGSILVLPGLVLLLGSLGALRGWWAGLLAAFLCAFIPATWTFAVSGYADLTLAAVFTVAALAALWQERPGAPAGALAGILPWIKLEGLVFCGLLVGVLLVAARRRRRWPLSYLLTCLAVAAIWPVLLVVHGLRTPLGEDVGVPDAAQRVVDILHGFAHPLLDLAGPHVLIWPVIILASLLSLRRSTPADLRWPALLVLAVLMADPLLVFLRTPVTSSVVTGDLPSRLVLAALPLGIHVLVSQAACTVGSDDRMD